MQPTLSRSFATLLIALPLLSFLSWIGSVYGWGTRSLYSAEGLRWFVANALPNLRKAPLTEALLMSVCLGLLAESNILKGCKDALSRHGRRTSLKQRRALQITLLAAILYVAVVLSLTLIPPYTLLNAFGSYHGSALSHGIPFLLLTLCACVGVVYGGLSGHFVTFGDILRGGIAWPTRLAAYYVAMLPAAEFLACLAYVFPDLPSTHPLWEAIGCATYALPLLSFIRLTPKHKTP